MPRYDIAESDRFLKDVEEAAVWILLSNIEQSESFAEKKVDEFSADLNALKTRLRDFPESGEGAEIEGIRKFPIYDGRYSVQWVVSYATRTVRFSPWPTPSIPRSFGNFNSMSSVAGNNLAHGNALETSRKQNSVRDWFGRDTVISAV